MTFNAQKKIVALALCGLQAGCAVHSVNKQFETTKKEHLKPMDSQDLKIKQGLPQVANGENEKKMTLENGETMTVFDLTIINKGGGHEMVDDGEDPSWVDLEVSTPRKAKVFFRHNFANLDSNSDADISFDNYTIRVEHVDFDGTKVKLNVKKKK